MQSTPANNDRTREATIIAHYLLHTTPSDRITQLYAAAVNDDPLFEDSRLVSFGFTHPRLLKTLDSGLALLNPNHELRRRIFIMFALLEASPEHTKFFLPVNRSFLYFIQIGIRGVGSVLHAILGVLIIKFGRFSV